MFAKKTAEKALLEKYDKFLVNNFKPGIAPFILTLMWKAGSCSLGKILPQ